MAVLGALGNPVRLRIVARLADGPVHVSELARRAGISRPLLYMHLERLQNAGLVVGRLELASDGRALKYYELAEFDVRLTVETVRAAVRADETDDGDMDDGDMADDDGQGHEQGPQHERGHEDGKETSG